ncbi:unnamed protein product [Linum tenue]|uniref:DUF7054 domain-containing protein n=1 Tax=Linum tenue TaxID=586396 RepID=A0AAV0QLS3_9ROSI|nr:unnamed protein product [Linum tenue]
MMEELKRNVKERVMAGERKHLNRLLGNVRECSNRRKNSNNNRFLISVTVPGSFGPIRFLANHGDTVLAVIRGALKRYAREGRFPAIGSNPHDFLLYRAYTGFDALNPGEEIGECGGWDFLLCKKQWPEMGKVEIVGEGRGGGSNCCKEWMFHSLIRKIWKVPTTTSRVGMQEEEAAAGGGTALLMKMVNDPAAWIQANGVDQKHCNSPAQVWS